MWAAFHIHLGCACLTLCLAIPSAETSPRQSNYAYAQALDFFQAGNYADAARLFEQAEAEAPAKSDALLFAAKSYSHLQRFPKADDTLRRYIANNPSSADGLYLLGYNLHRENKPKESLEIYTQAARILPPTGDDLKIVALDYVLLNDTPEAVHWLERAVALDPGNKEAWYFLGRGYYTQSRIPQAREAFEKVLEIDPRDSKAENNLGLIYESAAKPDEALAAYRKAIDWQQNNPHPSEQPYLNLGNLLMTLEHTNEAIPPLEKAAQLAPTNSQCLAKLGTAYLRAGRLNEARQKLEESIQLDPNDAAAHYQLGRYYKQVKHLDAAKKEFDRVAQLQGQAVEAQKAPMQH
jgi:tetratricopeptide (TPR) repeat protein